MLKLWRPNLHAKGKVLMEFEHVMKGIEMGLLGILEVGQARALEKIR